ncbi:MAG: substrate-binding domain-containing protein [Anaerolineales bacterium]|nr:substrate-binding domain-containing protein [Anaerolineales bacterium]
MNRTLVIFILIILAAVLIAGAGLAILAFNNTQESTASINTPIPAGAVVVEIHSSNTKQDWMNEVIETFNASNFTQDGKSIVVTVAHIGSGSSMSDILEGKTKPVVWSPGSNLWVTSINQAWQDRTGSRLITSECPATLRLPLAIAMWKPMAEALGWPNAPIGWDDLATLSASPDGWAAYGHPEWGEFKFGHPHPEHSNSGMLSLVAEVYSAAGLVEGLTVEQVKSQRVIDDVGSVEQHVYHYGKTDTDILLRMTQRGPEYLHAVTSYEANVIKWNRDHQAELRFPLVAIYPDDGTFWVENPYCVMDNADWVSEDQKQAAIIFRDYLMSTEQQALAIEWGLRPANRDATLHSPIDLEHGAVPSISIEDVPHLQYPSDEVVGHILDVWHQVKKKAVVILLLDISGSMQGAKIKSAVEGAVTFIDQMYPADEVIVVPFASEVYQLPATGPVGQVGEELKTSLRGLYAEGATALYQAVIQSVDYMENIQANDEAQGLRRLYGIVLLSDGMNELDGGPTMNDMLSHLPSGAEVSGVKIYTIAYGDDADLDVLTTLANRTNGKQFAGDVEDIEAVYFLISSEF